MILFKQKDDLITRDGSSFRINYEEFMDLAKDENGELFIFKYEVSFSKEINKYHRSKIYKKMQEIHKSSNEFSYDDVVIICFEDHEVTHKWNYWNSKKTATVKQFNFTFWIVFQTMYDHTMFILCNDENQFDFSDLI